MAESRLEAMATSVVTAEPCEISWATQSIFTTPRIVTVGFTTPIPINKAPLLKPLKVFRIQGWFAALHYHFEAL